ncbi:hypothetical protein Tco_0072688 [Tanacetum coccineum]
MDWFTADVPTAKLFLMPTGKLMVPAGSSWFLLVGFVVPAGLLTVSSASIIGRFDLCYRVQDSRDGEYTFKGKLIVDILNHLHASHEGKRLRVAQDPY